MASWLCAAPKDILEPIVINTSPKPKIKYAPMTTSKAEPKPNPKSVNRPNVSALAAMFGI